MLNYDNETINTSQMNVLFAAAELYPYIKTGGLGDVANSLPSFIAKEGVDIRLIVPGYPVIMDALKNAKPILSLTSPSGHALRVMGGTLDNIEVPVYVVESNDLFYRKGNPYIDQHGLEWYDNLDRFLSFSWAAANFYQATWIPDVIHANDWHTGLIAVYTNFLKQKNIKTVFTIHNIAYQGLYPYEHFGKLGLPTSYFAMEGIEFFNQICFMKSALQYSDAITTVSPSYVEELCFSEEFGMGFEKLLSRRKKDFYGILNGADYTQWSPEADKNLELNFSANELEVKQELKVHFLEQHNILRSGERFLIGVVTRLVTQKGVESIIKVIENFAALQVNATFAILGTGEPYMVKKLTEIQRQFPKLLIFYNEYDEVKAHRIIAYSDAFLMPSKFEPCGLTQIYALRYGTLPIVTPVGGLRDTVKNYDTDPEPTGFVSRSTSLQNVTETVIKATQVFQARYDKWKEMMLNAMKQDFTWEKSAQMYIALYTKLISQSAMDDTNPLKTEEE